MGLAGWLAWCAGTDFADAVCDGVEPEVQDAEQALCRPEQVGVARISSLNRVSQCPSGKKLIRLNRL